MELPLEGINFVTDSQNKRVAVMIDLTKYANLWEDIYDLLIVESRKQEDRISWDDIKNELKAEGKL